MGINHHPHPEKKWLKTKTKKNNHLKESSFMTPEKILEDQIIMTIKTVEDPEIPVNIYELGLIYFININCFEFYGGRDLIILPMKKGYNSPFICELPSE